MPSWNFWKPKQRVANLLVCEQRSGHWCVWVPLSLEQPLPLWTFQFIPLSFPQSQHMLYSQHSSVPWLWEGHQKADVWLRTAGLSLPGFTISPDLQIKKSIQCLKCKYYWLSDLPRSLWFLDRNHRCESEIHWPEILCIKAVCVLNSGGQTFVPGGCLLLYDSVFWNEAFPPTLLPPPFTFRKVRACFYLFSLLFFPSQIFFIKAWHRFLESDSCSDPWRLSSIVCWSMVPAWQHQNLSSSWP